MKKIFTLLLLFIALSVSNSYSQLFTESFDYTPHATQGLAAQSSGLWTRLNTGDSILVASGTLTYPGLIPSAGNKVTFGGAGVDYYASYTNQTTGTVYFSFLLNVPTIAPLTTAGDYFIGLIENNSTTNYFGRLWMRSATGGYNVGINAASTGANTVWSPTVLTAGATYLVVGSFEMVSGTGNDVSKIWVNPTALGGAEPAADGTSTNAGGNDPTGGIQRVILRQGNVSLAAGVLELDEIRIGTTWASVTPIPVSTPVLSATGSVTTLTTPQGVASAPQSFNVSGVNLTGFPSNIAVSSASSDIELSLNSGGPFSSSVNIPYASATLTATPVYARISASAATTGAVSSLVTVSGGGAPNATITISGNVTESEPTVQATNITFSNLADNSLDVNWTNGNGTSRIVVIRQTSAAAIPPVDGTTYTANPAVTGASSTGTGNFVVYNGTGTGPVSISNLFVGTNYTVTVYEYNGAAGAENYLTATATNNPASASTTGITNLFTQGYFTSIATPQFMGTFTGATQNRIPTMFVAKVTGLAPNTVYKYYMQATNTSDFGTSNTAAGGSLLINYNTTTTTPVTYSYIASGSFTGTNYSYLTTDATGSFQGTFGFIHTTNTRFTKGNDVYPAIILVDDASGSTNPRYRFLLNQSIKALDFSADSDGGSYLRGLSSATPGNLVAVWSSVDGNLVAQRPLSMTLAEVAGSASNWIGASAIAGYDYTAGAWNTIIPNENPEGVRLIQQINPLTGAIVGCNSDADGEWTSASTTDPNTGTTPLEITAAEAPINAGSCFSILPVRISNFAVQKSGNTTKIVWTTQQEVNSKEFVVERSTDGRTWTAIATVAAAGNSASLISYSATDYAPAKGINFYRLRMVDLDNRAENSATKSVLFGNADVVLITPNPATTSAIIYMGKADNSLSQIFVSDMNGKLVERINTADQTHTLQLARYSKGLYIIKVVSGAATSTHKLAVQ